MSDRKRRPMQWFKFDPTVVGTIVEDLDLSGQGAYFKLMRSLWVFGPLSEAEVRRKCGPTFEQLRELMCPVGECLSFAWLEALRSDGQHVSDVRAAAATVRHSKQKEASDVQLHANAMQLPSISKSSSKSQERKERAEAKTLFCNSRFMAIEVVKESLPELVAEGVDLTHYRDAIRNWSDAKDEKRTDRGWLATFRQWTKTDRDKGELKKTRQVSNGWNPRA